MKPNRKRNDISRSKRITVNAFLAALILSFAVFPVAFGPLQLAVLQIIAVIVAAELLGLKNGAAMGLFFGLVSLITAIARPNILSQAFYNPLVSVLPRILIGVNAYAVTHALLRTAKRKDQPSPLVEHARSLSELKTQCASAETVLAPQKVSRRIPFRTLAYALGAAAGVLTNTVLVLGMIMVFHYGKTFGGLLIGWEWIAATIVTNSILELAVTVVVTPPVVLTLKMLFFREKTETETL